MPTLNDYLKRLRKAYTYGRKDGFLYNHPSELRKKGDTIGVMALLFSEEDGLRTHIYTFKRKRWTPDEWTKFLHKPKYQDYVGGIELLVNDVIPARNAALEEEYGLVKILGWSFDMADKHAGFH